MPTSPLMRFRAAGSDDRRSSEGRHGNRVGSKAVSSAHFLKLLEEGEKIGFWSSHLIEDDVTLSIGFCRILGIDPRIRWADADLPRIVHPDDRTSYADMCATLRLGHPVDRQYRVVRPDQTVRWIRNRAEIIVDAECRPVRAVGVVVDVTEVLEIRRSIRRAAERYQALVGAIAVVEWRAAADGEMQHVPAWEALTGQTQEQSAGWGWLDAIHPHDREATFQTWQEALSRRVAYAIDYRVRNVDGAYQEMYARAAPVLEADGGVREWVGVLLRSAERGVTDTDRSAPGDRTDRRRLSPIQIRAARSMLGWSVADLCAATGLSLSSIRRMESSVDCFFRERSARSVREAFEAKGVTFSEGQDGSINVSYNKDPISSR